MRERVLVTNHGLDDVVATVALHCDVDFADLFAVKEGRVPHDVQADATVVPSGLRFARSGGTGAVVEVRADRTATAGPRSLSWRAEVPARATWEVCLEVVAALAGDEIEPRFRCGVPEVEALPARRLATWLATLPTVDSDVPKLNAAVRRAGDDLGALRIFDPDHPDVPIVAAGAPWFMTVFGRDSLLTAWMTLLADRTLARGVLETLARFQGSDLDPLTEEEPGKILHEMRFGGAAGLALRGGDIYYGSIDATPLFVMLLGELRRWDAGDPLVERLLPNADRALAWIEEFGDRDGDGLVEYERASEQGLANQGWKDSWDSVRHRDGDLARPPIALCEVQGYVYAAYVARAHLALDAGDRVTFERYRDRALDLRRRFDEAFWLEEHGWYALGLDADKRPVDALASNMGHCLWTGIVEPGRAGAVAARLLSTELFSGWGIRTLATSMASYNPVSYHNGSVWPHDNALCAAGLARYGYVEEAHRVIRAQLRVADALGGRLPELFAGFDRRRLGVPAAYPTSCSPQAWASAAPLLWIRTLLRFDPWASHGEVNLAPELPPWLGRLCVEGVAVGEQRLTITAERGGEVSLTGAGGFAVVTTARPPLTPMFLPDDGPGGRSFAPGRARTPGSILEGVTVTTIAADPHPGQRSAQGSSGGGESADPDQAAWPFGVPSVRKGRPGRAPRARQVAARAAAPIGRGRARAGRARGAEAPRVQPGRRHEPRRAGRGPERPHPTRLAGRARAGSRRPRRARRIRHGPPGSPTPRPAVCGRGTRATSRAARRGTLRTPRRSRIPTTSDRAVCVPCAPRDGTARSARQTGSEAPPAERPEGRTLEA